MSFVYTGTPSTVTVDNLYKLTLPQDGIDQASATTVVPAFKIAVDEIAKIGQILASSRLQVSIYIAGGPLIVSPFSPVFVDSGSKIIYMSKDTPTNLTIANKEGGGNFTPNTFYYVYASSTDGTPNFVISSDVPDKTLTTKNSAAINFTRFRYFGSILANSPTTAADFTMVNFDYSYSIPQNSNFIDGNPFIPATFGSTTAANLPSCPTTAKSVKILSTLNHNGVTGQPYYFSISSVVLSLVQTGYPGILVRPNNAVTLAQDIPIDITSGPRIIIGAPSGSSVNDVRAYFWVRGYKE